MFLYNKTSDERLNRTGEEKKTAIELDNTSGYAKLYSLEVHEELERTWMSGSVAGILP